MIFEGYSQSAIDKLAKEWGYEFKACVPIDVMPDRYDYYPPVRGWKNNSTSRAKKARITNPSVGCGNALLNSGFSNHRTPFISNFIGVGMADFTFGKPVGEEPRIQVKIKAEPAWDRNSFFPEPVLWCCSNFGKCQHSNAHLYVDVLFSREGRRDDV